MKIGVIYALYSKQQALLSARERFEIHNYSKNVKIHLSLRGYMKEMTTCQLLSVAVVPVTPGSFTKKGNYKPNALHRPSNKWAC